MFYYAIITLFILYATIYLVYAEGCFYKTKGKWGKFGVKDSGKKCENCGCVL